MSMTSTIQSEEIRSGSKNRVVTNTKLKLRKGIKMQTITKPVNKKVTHPVSGEKVTRTANVSFPAPSYDVVQDKEGRDVLQFPPTAVQDAIAVFGSSDKLIQYAIFGLWNQVRTNESNALAQGDKITRSVRKASKALKQAMPSITDDMLRTLLMATPDFAANFANVEFQQIIDREININELDAPIVKGGTVDTEDEEESDDEEVDTK